MSEPPTRPYRKRKRAAAEERTRRRITEAAVELHGTIGPAAATVTDIAKLAGVSRMTVYNHFSTDVELFTACSAHWAESNPLPDPSAWSHTDPGERLDVALNELYTWYRSSHRMLANVLGDMQNLPALAEVMNSFWLPWMGGVLDALGQGWTTDGDQRRTLDATLRLAVDFNSWRILSESGLDDAVAAALMARMVGKDAT